MRDSRGLQSIPLSFTVTDSPPLFHQSSIKGPDQSYESPNGLDKSSQQKQTTQDFFILAVKLDSALMCLCVCDKKLYFLSWTIRLVFTVTITLAQNFKAVCYPHIKVRVSKYIQLEKL